MSGAAEAAASRRTFALLVAAVFAVALGYGVVLPVLPFLLERLLPPDAGLAWHVGTMSASYMAALAIAAPLWGRAGDRYGRRVIILVGLAGLSAALLAFGLTTRLWFGYTARIVAGGFAGAVLPAALAYVSDTSEAGARAKRFGWISAASVAGFLAGPAIGGWLAGTSGWGGMSATALPLVAAGVVGALVLLGVWRSLPELYAVRSLVRDARRAPARKSVRTVLLLSLLAMFGLGAFEVGLTLQGQQRLALTPGELGFLFFACSLAMAGAQVCLFAPLAARLTGPGAVVAAFLAMAAGFVWLVGPAERSALWWSLALIAPSSGLLIPLLAYRASLISASGQGAGLGAQTAAASLGQALGSAAGGWLYAAMNQASFWIAAALLLLGGIVALGKPVSARVLIVPFYWRQNRRERRSRH